MLSSLSKLAPEQIEEIKKLEKEIGKTLLSFSKYDVVSDDLTEDELRKLKALEQKMGTTLVAVRASILGK
ncbi:MAG: hypothetical protein HGB19_11725 [Chlorobiales bacterium]|jgi:hypothetical protein|nr:hypothetical protein [Chlorobiales bacterium]